MYIFQIKSSYELCYYYIIFVTLFSDISGAPYMDTNSRIAMKQKKMDMAYGEMLSSLETGRNSHIKLAFVKIPASKTEPTTQKDISRAPTKCSTKLPLTLDPQYVPSSSDEENNEINIHSDYVESQEEGIKKYKGPAELTEPHLYYDDN